MAVVNTARRVREVAFQKLLVDAFDQNIKTEFSFIKSHHGISCPGNGRSGGFEKFTADFLLQITTVLNRIVQVNFLEPVKFLARSEFVEVHRECGKIIQRAEAPGT